MRHASPGYGPLKIASLLAALVLIAACDTPPAGVLAPAEDPALRSQSATDFDLVFEDVAVRPAASADIHVHGFVNEARPCRDPARTAFLVHGVNATAASWGRFAEAFLTGDPQDQLCLVLAMDHPGHGASTLPTGVLFGELMIQDYARAAMEVLDRLDLPRVAEERVADGG